jgi:hypothetical protein
MFAEWTLAITQKDLVSSGFNKTSPTTDLGFQFQINNVNNYTIVETKKKAIYFITTAKRIVLVLKQESLKNWTRADPFCIN